MRLGGESDPRNKALMKMFNLINIGERAGSGVPGIFSAWKAEGWVEPIIEEQFDPARTILTLKTVSVLRHHMDMFLENVAQEGNLSKEDLEKLSDIMKYAEYMACFKDSEFEENVRNDSLDIVIGNDMSGVMVIEYMSNKLMHYQEKNERLRNYAQMIREKLVESAEKNVQSAEKTAESADSNKKRLEELSNRQNEILLLMEKGREYSVEEIARSIGLKGSRTRQILNELAAM